MVGRVRTVLVIDGQDPVAVPAAIVATRRTSTRQRLRQVGPGRFDPKAIRHIRGVVLPVADRILAPLQPDDEHCYDLSIRNLGAASAWDTNVEVSGFSMDMSVLLAILSVSLGLNTPEDTVVSGHIASTDGDTGVVCHLPEKVDAMDRDAAIRRFVYASGEGDESLQVIAPKEAARLILAIRNAQDSLCCVSVGNVEELLKTILTEEDILYAALDRNQPVAMQKGKHDDPITRAVLHLGGDLEDRFWETMRRLLFSGLVDQAKALLLTRARSSLRAEEYPASIGARLAALVASVPRHVIVDPSIFPLLPMGPCMDLLRLAGGGEDEDAVMLLDAVRNMKGGRGTPARADNSNDGDSGSAEAILRSILSEISAIGLANSVTGPIDEARTTFPLGSVVVSSEEEFHDGVTRYFRHMICHCDRAIYAKPRDVAAAALDLVRRAFESSGGLHAAMGEAKAATRGGMRAILDQMTEQFRQERTGMHVQAVLAQKTSDLSWEQKVALVRHVQDSVGPQLPQDLRMRRPEELAATCELVLRRYVQVVNRWHTELPFMIDRR